MSRELSESGQILRQRREHLGRGLSLSYDTPLTIVRGEGAYLFDETGRRYLDCVNNVCHVGHCHPHVVRAISEQAAVLNTNTRYLHPQLSSYVERLAQLLPDPLSVVYPTCSGSEATELALRIARTYTGGSDVVAIESAYHGNTQAAIDVSHYKFAGPGGRGAPPSTHVTRLPCRYRGEFRGERADVEYAKGVARDVGLADDAARLNGRSLAAFIGESMLGVAGQIELPQDYLRAAYRAVRARGGVAIADEVQVGFGRCGAHWWAFELQGVVPDLVVLGKPIGNGHPLAAVVTTSEISAAFDNGMEYFNTFGGNPVSCAAGNAVLDVLEGESLRAHADRVGAALLHDLRELGTRYEIVGDVRGRGLFIGIELVRDRATLEPADREAAAIVEAMRERGILLSVDGPLHNVIKIKPPMVFSLDDARELSGVFSDVLASFPR